MKISRQLQDYLLQAPPPWIEYDPATGKVIVVADNNLLQNYRNCPQHFFYSNVLGFQKKSGLREGERQRSWYLDFGVLLHKMLEIYYQEFRKPTFDVFEWASVRGSGEWAKAKMDDHAEHKEYKLIGGVAGFVGLLAQYGLTMTPLNERLRVLGSEVSFGHGKEVPLVVGLGYEFYLAGRMDLIVDDGYYICPMDHKTMGSFRGDPGLQFETEEGPTGYVFALSKILPTFVPEEQLLKRDCSKILMNLIQKKPTKEPSERFRRVPVRKTTEQLESYRRRMVQTIEHLLLDLEAYVRDAPIPRNTTACVNWHYGTCDYRDVCRQCSRENEEATLRNGFLQLPVWNTEAVQPAKL